MQPFLLFFALFLLFSVFCRKISEQNAYISKLEMTVQNQRYVNMIYDNIDNIALYQIKIYLHIKMKTHFCELVNKILLSLNTKP